jgi:hypothetical protein
MTPDGHGCLQCHASQQSGFNQSHAFAADNCVICHAGDATATNEEAKKLRTPESSASPVT